MAAINFPSHRPANGATHTANNVTWAFESPLKGCGELLPLPMLLTGAKGQKGEKGQKGQTGDTGVTKVKRDRLVARVHTGSTGAKGQKGESW